MKLKILGSSSKGNCYILETLTGSLMLECGVRFKDIQKALNFNFNSVCGCLVTHEHKDHCKAVSDIIKSGIDVYLSDGTGKSLGLYGHRVFEIKPLEQFSIKDFVVLPFSTEHDAAEPLGYLIQYKPTGEKLLFATDTYYLKYKFKGLNYIMIECNYNKDVLDANIKRGLIPDALKNRLLESHFSLDNVKTFLKENDLSKVRKIILLHLSDGNSDEKVMQREINELTEIETIVADEGMETELKLNPF